MAARLEIETDRMVLIPMCRDDVGEMHRLFNDPQVRKYLWDDKAVSAETTESVFRQSLATFQSRRFGLWIARLKGEKALIGFCGYRLADDTNEIEMLYGLLPDYWNRGLTTEAVRAVLGYGFERLGFDRVVAATDRPNVASRRVMEKAGMNFLKQVLLDGRETLWFAISKDEFEQNPAGC